MIKWTTGGLMVMSGMRDRGGGREGKGHICPSMFRV